MISVVLRSGETAAYETNRSQAAVRVNACASGKAGVVQPSIGVALIATSKSRHAVGPGVVVTVSPKHPLSLGSVYAETLATAPSVAPAFTRREVS